MTRMNSCLMFLAAFIMGYRLVPPSILLAQALPLSEAKPACGPSTETRTVKFRDDFSVGGLGIVPWGAKHRWEGWDTSKEILNGGNDWTTSETETVESAIGTVTIPPGMQVEFGFRNDVSIRDIPELPHCAVQYLNTFNLMRVNEIYNFLQKFDNQQSIYGASFGTCYFDSTELKPLMNHPELRGLRLSRCGWDGPLFTEIKGHPGLKSIWIRRSGLKSPTSATLLQDLDSLTGLNYLTFSAGGTTDKDLEIIGRLPNLRGLVIQMGNECTSHGLLALKSLRSLEQIMLPGWELNLENQGSAAFELLSSLPSLREVDFSGSYLVDSDFPAIIALRNLKTVHLRSGYPSLAESIDKLRDARPDMTIYVDEKLLPNGKHLAWPRRVE